MLPPPSKQSTERRPMLKVSGRLTYMFVGTCVESIGGSWRGQSADEARQICSHCKLR